MFTKQQSCGILPWLLVFFFVNSVRFTTPIMEGKPYYYILKEFDYYERTSNIYGGEKQQNNGNL